MGQKLDEKRTRDRLPTTQLRGQRGHRRRHSRAEWQQLRARVDCLAALALERPELAAVAVPMSAMADRWTYFVTLARLMEQKAAQMGLLAGAKQPLAAKRE